jgi:hypothetical protein
MKRCPVPSLSLYLSLSLGKDVFSGNDDDDGRKKKCRSTESGLTGFQYFSVVAPNNCFLHMVIDQEEIVMIIPQDG